MGATEAHSAAEFAKSIDVVYTCVPSAEVVAALAREMLPVLRPGQSWIDATTSLPETSKRIAARLEKVGTAFADAPVTGGPKQAADGEPASLIGCDEGQLQRVLRTVARYSRLSRRLGTSGSGNAAKLRDNLVSQETITLLADAFRIAAESGVD